MKLATFEHDGRVAVGAVDGRARRIVDLQRCHVAQKNREHPALTGMLALIDSGAAGLDLVRELVAASDIDDAAVAVPLEAARLLAPVPEPRQLRDFSVYERHLQDAPAALSKLAAQLSGQAPPAASGPRAVPKVYRDQPLFYFSNRFNVVGTDSDVPWPRDSAYLDFELELGICLGRTGRNITRDRARDFIFGYTIFNDVSARDVQARQMPGGLGPCKGKSYDGCNALGPWLVTPDELPDPHGLRAQVRVNGEIWADTSTAGMLHSFEDMIVFASRDETIHAGEVFGSGTVGGCCGLEMDRWIRCGDVVELEVEGIGVLRNRYIEA